jgi:hypothetical protein
MRANWSAFRDLRTLRDTHDTRASRYDTRLKRFTRRHHEHFTKRVIFRALS